MITNESSHFVSSGASESFSCNEEFQTTMEFTEPGVVWQWIFKSDSICGHSSTKTNHLTLAVNGAQEPCCLPSAFRDFSNPHSGGCDGLRGEPSVNLC
jgi:hypothetical protein